MACQRARVVVSRVNCRRFGPAAGVGGHHLLGCSHHVVPQVPAVGDLECGRGAAADGFGIGCRPVTHDELDAGVGPQPGFQGDGAAVGQDIDALVGRGVDQHGAVAVAAQQGEVIHTEHPPHLLGLQRDAEQHPHRGLPRQPHRPPPEHPGRGPPGQFSHRRTQVPGQPGSAPLRALHHAGDLFPERALTSRRRTVQAPDTHHHATQDGEVTHIPPKGVGRHSVRQSAWSTPAASSSAST